MYSPKTSRVFSSPTISGVPVFVGKDYLVCQTPREIVDAPFNRVIIRVEPRGSGGHTTRGGAVTFKARLAEFEQTSEPVTVVSADASMEMSGTIAVVATDHCIVQAPEGTRFHFPIGQIALIIRPRPDV